MSTGYSNRVWACPYFRWDEKTAVHCEGGVVRLPDQESLIAYAEAMCGSVDHWSRCSVARALTQWYEEKERDSS